MLVLFCGCIKRDYKNKYLVPGDWSQSRSTLKGKNLKVAVHSKRNCKEFAPRGSKFFEIPFIVDDPFSEGVKCTGTQKIG